MDDADIRELSTKVGELLRSEAGRTQINVLGLVKLYRSAFGGDVAAVETKRDFSAGLDVEALLFTLFFISERRSADTEGVVD